MNRMKKVILTIIGAVGIVPLQIYPSEYKEAHQGESYWKKAQRHGRNILKAPREYWSRHKKGIAIGATAGALGVGATVAAIYNRKRLEELAREYANRALEYGKQRFAHWRGQSQSTRPAEQLSVSQQREKQYGKVRLIEEQPYQNKLSDEQLQQNNESVGIQNRENEQLARDENDQNSVIAQEERLMNQIDEIEKAGYPETAQFHREVLWKYLDKNQDQRPEEMAKVLENYRYQISKVLMK